MKKNFKYFGIVWLVTFILFNAVTFIVPAEIAGINRFEKPVFWISYALICVAFLSQLVSAYVVCNKNRAEKVFLHIPLYLISVTLPESITSIGEGSFQYCNKLVEVINKSSNIIIEKGSSGNGYLGYNALEVFNSNDSYIHF